MDHMNLRVSLDKAVLIAEAIEHLPVSDWQQRNQKELSRTLAWLRYRITRYAADHPRTTQR